MKEYLVHIPTAQYEFVEVKAKSAEEARLLRDEVLNSFKDLGELLTPKEFDRVVETYIKGSITMDDQDNLGDTKLYSQRDIMNIIRRAIARIKNTE